MAMTITQVSTPNAGQTWGQDGQFRSLIVDLTFDNAYPTGGLVVTAAALGFSTVVDAIVVKDPAPSGNASSLRSRAVANSAQTQLAFQLFSAGIDPIDAFTVQAPSVTILADKNTDMLVVPYAGTITSVTYTAAAAITGANSPASRTVTLANLTAATTPAQLAWVSGVNHTIDVPKTVTLGAANQLGVALNDVLQWQSLHIGGTGLVDPGGLVSVTIAPTFTNLSLKELAASTDASTVTGRYKILGF